MSINPESIQQAKGVSIVDYLLSKGIEPVKTTSDELVYLSPITQERTPSFFVNPQKNVFADYSSDHKGDIITLVSLLEKCSFVESINKILDNQPKTSFSFSGKLPTTDKASSNVIQLVKPLQHIALIQYVESRKIPFRLAQCYLKEIHYQNTKGVFFSIGFQNDKGGFELRNNHFKGGTHPKGITTIVGAKKSPICLFEGFFDFLSALVFFQRQTPLYTSIILNSTSNLNQALPALLLASQVNCFLDTDKAGIASLEKLQRANVNIHDCSYFYAPNKDFNEKLIQQ